jgi:hypothetical protein
VGSCWLLASCGVYLHDDTLQKQTDTVLSTYKSADVVGTMKAALDAQAQLDKAELQGVGGNETAERERAVADLISSYPLYGGGLAIKRLETRIDQRITALVSTGVNPADWLGMHEKLVGEQTLADELQRELVRLKRAYAAVGGKNFTSCDTFTGADGVTIDLQTAARYLKAQCALLAQTQPTGKVQQTLDAVFNAAGEIARIHEDLLKIVAAIDTVTKAKNDALKALQDAQKQLKDNTKDPNTIDTEVSDRLKQLSELLKGVDQATGTFGDKNFSIGNALAAIQFRKANLRDVLAASTGGTASPAASDAQRAIVGVVAGVIKINDTANAPSIPALSIALAYQDGLEKAAQAQLDALTEHQALLQDQQASLLRELELLAVAKRAAADANNGLSSGSCIAIGFAEIFPNSSCPLAARAAAARALTAYNLSWASGRTAARLDDRKISQLITWRRLRASQEAAVARANVQTIALTELDAYGQGGIKPETIAAFLQALGVVAIAKGVN